MLARKQTENTREATIAKQILKMKGWSYRTAAPHLGVGYVHLARVLNGIRQSKSLLNRIYQLPNNPQK